jgi:CBS domain-containing protein
MQVAEVMSRAVASIDPNSMVGDAAVAMRDSDVGALVVMEDNAPIGIVTDRDIVVRGVATGKTPLAVREVMSQGVASCRESDDLADAAQIMSDHKVRRLPVMNEEGRLVGVVGIADVLRSQEAEPAATEAMKEITEPTPHQPRR